LLEQHALQQEQQPEAQAQPEITPQPTTELPGIDPEIVEAIQRSPKLLATLQEEALRVQQTVQGAEQARQHAAAVVAQATQAALNATIGMYPELAGVPGDQVHNVLRAVQQNNPARYNDIVSHLARVDQISQANQRIRAEQEAVAQQQNAAWAKSQDDLYDAATKDDSPEMRNKIGAEALSMLKEYGATDDDIRQAWNSPGPFRSAIGQRILRDAAAYRLSRREVGQKLDRSVPPVQRPGTSQRGSYAESEIAAAREAFLKNPDDPRLAARFVSAKRSARS
jgi:hypothetical protein